MKLALPLLALLVATTSLRAGQSLDAAGVFAAMRRALGGDHAFTRFRRCPAAGRRSERSPAAPPRRAVEYARILPDRCIKVRRIASPFPVAFSRV